jgi:hypothetical protein
MRETCSLCGDSKRGASHAQFVIADASRAGLVGAALHRRQLLCLQHLLPENKQPEIIWQRWRPTDASA